MKAVAIAILMLALGLPAWADMKTDLAVLVADNDSAHLIRALVPFIVKLPVTEVPAAVTQAEQDDGPGRGDVLEALAGRWVEVDAKAALAYVEHDEFRDLPSFVFDAYYSAWARRDLTGARAAVAQLPPGTEHATAAYALATFLAPRDPAQAYALTRSVVTTLLQGIDYPIYWNWARQDLAAATQTLIQDSGYGQNRPDVDLTWDIVDSLYDQDPPAAAKWISSLPEGKLPDTAIGRLVDIAGRRDPIGAVALFKRVPASDRTQDTIRSMATSAEYSPAGAPVPIKTDRAFAAKAREFAQLREEPLAWRRDQRMIAFLDGLAPPEFPLALEQLRRAPPFGCEDELDLLLAKWTEVDLAGAIAAIPQVRGFYDNIFAQRVATGLFGGWSQRDPEAAFACARQQPQGYWHCDVLETTLGGLAHKNPIAAYAAFRALNDPNSQILVRPVFREWAEADLSAATKALAHEPHFEGAIEGMVESRLKHGFMAAVRWAHGLKNPAFRDKALTAVALRANDTEATLAWLEREPDFPGKHSALDDIAVDWSNRNNLAALRHALKLPAGSERSTLMMWGLTAYAYDDAPAAAIWCEALPDGKEKQDALGTVFGTWTETSPQAAAHYLSGKPADATAFVLQAVAGSWSQFDPVQAAQWLKDFPTKESKSGAMAKTAQEWYRGDPVVATQWVIALSTGPDYDAGAKGICDALGGQLPPALKWARSIGDAKIRHDAVYQAYDLGTAPMRGQFASSPEIKDEIQAEKELSNDEKKGLLSRLPTLQMSNLRLEKPTTTPH